MKRCSICEIEQPLEQFHRDKNRKDGRHLECRTCRSRKTPPPPLPTEKRCSECREMKPLDEFYAATQSRSRHKRQSNCRRCTSEMGKRRREADPEYSRRITASGYWKRYRWARIYQRYGLTRAEYEVVLSAQGGVCALCGGNNRGSPLVVDHNHATGQARGLLCVGCNSALGHVERAGWIEKANAYLSSDGMHKTGGASPISMS